MQKQRGHLLVIALHTHNTNCMHTCVDGNGGSGMHAIHTQQTYRPDVGRCRDACTLFMPMQKMQPDFLEVPRTMVRL